MERPRREIGLFIPYVSFFAYRRGVAGHVWRSVPGGEVVLVAGAIASSVLLVAGQPAGAVLVWAAAAGHVFGQLHRENTFGQRLWLGGAGAAFAGLLIAPLAFSSGTSAEVVRGLFTSVMGHGAYNALVLAAHAATTRPAVPARLAQRLLWIPLASLDSDQDPEALESRHLNTYAELDRLAQLPLEKQVEGLMQLDSMPRALVMTRNEFLQLENALRQYRQGRPMSPIVTIEKMVGALLLRTRNRIRLQTHPESFSDDERRILLSPAARRLVHGVVQGEKINRFIRHKALRDFIALSWDLKNHAIDASVKAGLLADYRDYLTRRTFGQSDMPRTYQGRLQQSDVAVLMQRTLEDGIRELEDTIRRMDAAALEALCVTNESARAALAKKLTKDIPAGPTDDERHNEILTQLRRFWKDGYVPDTAWLRKHHKDLWKKIKKIFKRRVDLAYKEAGFPIPAEFLIIKSGLRRAPKKVETIIESLNAEKRPFTMKALHEAGILQLVLHMRGRHWPTVVKHYTGAVVTMPELLPPRVVRGAG